MGVKVGIDLGTTFCAVAWRNPRTGVIEVVKSDRNSSKLITPSAVQVFEDGTYACGAVAKEAFEDAEEGVATGFKRSMGTDEYRVEMPDGKIYDSEELSSMLLGHLKACAEASMGQEIDEAVITVPAYFEDGPRQATRRAAQKAGLKVRDIISEPTAAALNYGLNHWRENAKILVYDLGGGTFDVTLVGMQKGTNLCTIGTIGEHRRGGRDWDERLTALVVRKFRQETGCEDEDLDVNDLRGQAEQWKVELSQKSRITIKTRVDGYGAASVDVTREEFEEESRDLLELTGSLCEKLMSDLKLKWRDITDVLLVGGSTRMPQVNTYLTAKLGKAPITHVNPDQAVALGAAMRANMGSSQVGYEVEIISDVAPSDELIMSLKKPVKEAEAVELEDISYSDAVAHAMGIILADADKLEYVNRTVIPKYSPTPCKCAIATKHDKDEMEIYVVQGEGSIASCTVNRKYVVSNIHGKPGDMVLVRVQYSYDGNHIIHVQARQGKENVDLPIREEEFTSRDLETFMKPIDPAVFTPEMTIVMALDVSGSMSGDPMKDAKREMEKFVKEYGGSAKFGVIAVSDKSTWIVKPTKNTNAVISGIRSMTCGSEGYGNRAHPFETVRECYKPGGKYVTIVMADGVWSYQDDAIRAANKCHAEGIDVIGMGFGDADQTFLRAISNNPGLAQYTKDSTGLGASFGKIGQTLSSGNSKGSSFKFFEKKSRGDDHCDTWETVSD